MRAVLPGDANPGAVQAKLGSLGAPLGFRDFGFAVLWGLGFRGLGLRVCGYGETGSTVKKRISLYSAGSCPVCATARFVSSSGRHAEYLNPTCLIVCPRPCDTCRVRLRASRELPKAKQPNNQTHRSWCNASQRTLATLSATSEIRWWQLTGVRLKQQLVILIQSHPGSAWTLVRRSSTSSRSRPGTGTGLSRTARSQPWSKTTSGGDQKSHLLRGG